MRIKLDENLGQRGAELLRAGGFDVATAHEPGSHAVRILEADSPYLDLLKRSLLGLLDEDPAMAIFDAGASGFSLAPAPFSAQRRAEGLDVPSRALTMIGQKRLDHLHACVDTALRDGVPGDLAETGVWRGGASIFMRGALKVHGVTERLVWVADSFQGLPKPCDAPWLSVSADEVRAAFARYGLLDEQVRFLEGWFKDTLPQAPIERLAVLRLDGDLYESTMDALNPLYPKLSPGGFLVIDDYGLEPCRAAIHDYRREHGVTEPIERIDAFGAFWRRTH